MRQFSLTASQCLKLGILSTNSTAPLSNPLRHIITFNCYQGNCMYLVQLKRIDGKRKKYWSLEANQSLVTYNWKFNVQHGLQSTGNRSLSQRLIKSTFSNFRNIVWSLPPTSEQRATIAHIVKRDDEKLLIWSSSKELELIGASSKR